MEKVEFTCSACGKEFEIEWNFGDDVTCPHCKIEFSTDYDEDCDGNIVGPWLVEKEDGK